eukprot:TRINITY_DN775906_c0_g1_i1.p1 TRINITY_DN775906_c0_g1~~TRINITY_DN775906_c0_g1_i1.p1  ORF type:complete len:275 (+),score=37.59 TRINITY_DN775906_c0_g1_i1:86-910(+)
MGKFNVGDIVVARSTEQARLALAKIESIEPGRKYTVSYIGLGAKFNESLIESKLSKIQKSDFSKFKELQEAESNKTIRINKKMDPIDINIEGGSEESFYVALPKCLRELLVNDKYRIEEDQTNVKIPVERGHSIADIFEDFYKDTQSLSHPKNYALFGECFKQLFNFHLSKSLLYKIERNQYERVSEDNIGIPPCHLYGAEHILRFLVLFPQLMETSPLSAESRRLIHPKFCEFVRFLAKAETRKKYFLPTAHIPLKSHERTLFEQDQRDISRI